METEDIGNNVNSGGYPISSTGTSFELIENHNTTDASLLVDLSLIDVSMQLIALGSTSNETKNPSKTPLKQNTQNNLHSLYFYQNKRE